MTERLNDAARNRAADSVGDDFNSATLEIRTGTQPAAGGAATGTLLVSMTLPADAMGAASTGIATKLGTWSGTAGNTGSAGWFRVISSAGGRWYDGAVTATGGGGEIELSTVSITSTQVIALTSFTITQLAE